MISRIVFVYLNHLFLSNIDSSNNLMTLDGELGAKVIHFLYCPHFRP